MTNANYLQSSFNTLGLLTPPTISKLGAIVLKIAVEAGTDLHCTMMTFHKMYAACSVIKTFQQMCLAYSITKTFH